MKFFASIIVVGLLLFGTASADPIDDGWKVYKAGKFEEAIRIIEPLAHGGNVKAQVHMGMIYMDKAHPNYVKQFYWYKRAAVNGFAPAQVMVGSAYSKGRGVKKNLKEAVRWYRKAAEQCDVRAQFNMGNIYYLGEGVAKNFLLAQMWWKISILSGDDFGRNNSNIAAEKMTVTELEKSNSLARSWMARHPKCLADDPKSTS